MNNQISPAMVYSTLTQVGTIASPKPDRIRLGIPAGSSGRYRLAQLAEIWQPYFAQYAGLAYFLSPQFHFCPWRWQRHSPAAFVV